MCSLPLAASSPGPGSPGQLHRCLLLQGLCASISSQRAKSMGKTLTCSDRKLAKSIEKQPCPVQRHLVLARKAWGNRGHSKAEQMYPRLRTQTEAAFQNGNPLRSSQQVSVRQLGAHCSVPGGVSPKEQTMVNTEQTDTSCSVALRSTLTALTRQPGRCWNTAMQPTKSSGGRDAAPPRVSPHTTRPPKSPVAHGALHMDYGLKSSVCEARPTWMRDLAGHKCRKP